MYRHAVLTAVVLVLLTSSCEPHIASSATASFDTLPGGLIVVHNSGPAWTDEDRWRPVEILRIGSEDGRDPAALFADVRSVLLDGQGRVYVLEAQASEVRVFDIATASHIRTFGRDGRGPGELRTPNGMFWGPSGHLWVVDPRNGRYSVFDTTGVYLDAHPRPLLTVGVEWRGRMEGAGRLVTRTSRQVPGGSGPLGRSQSVLVSFNPTAGTAPADTFALPDFEQEAVEVSFGNVGGMTGSMPFSPTLALAFDGDGGYWSGTGDEYRLVHRRLAGDSIRVVRVDRAAESLTDVHRQEGRDYWERALRGRAPVPDLAGMPDELPFFGALLLDDREHLWVVTTPSITSGFVPRDASFDVFDPKGLYLGAVDLEIGSVPRPSIRGDLVAGVTRDALDVPYLVVYRLEGRGG